MWIIEYVLDIENLHNNFQKDDSLTLRPTTKKNVECYLLFPIFAEIRTGFWNTNPDNQ